MNSNVYIVLRTIKNDDGKELSTREILAVFSTMQAAEQFLKEAPGESVLKNNQLTKEARFYRQGETWYYHIETRCVYN